MKSLFILVALILSSCTYKTVLPVENESDLDSVVQSCGGQVWGYSKRFKGPDYSGFKGKDYLDALVLIVSNANDPNGEIGFELIIKTRLDVNFKFDPKQIQLSANGAKAKIEATDFKFLVEKIKIDQLYPFSDYKLEPVPGKENTWNASKKIIGVLWTKDPVEVVAEKNYQLDVTTNKIEYKIDKEKDAQAYIMIMARVKKNKYTPRSQFKLTLPQFSFSDKSVVPKQEYTFNYDEKAIDAALAVNTRKRCAEPRLLMLKLDPGYNYNPMRWMLLPFEGTITQ